MSNETNPSRRNFLKQASALGVLGGVSAVGLGTTWQLNAAEDELLRPPAAVNEEEFMALCIKCGQCLQVCPYDSIRLADIGTGNSVGTPYVEPLRRGCYLCPLLPCVLACPSGALDHHIEDAKDANMGIAGVIKLSDCLAMDNTPVGKDAVVRAYENSHTVTMSELKALKLDPISNPSEKRELEEKEIRKMEKFPGEQCTICTDMCPLPNAFNAIALEDNGKGGKQPVIKEECVGCGVCVELCPKRVLTIYPRKTFKETT